MKDGFKSATIIATLNLLSWKKDYRIWSVGTVIMVLIIRYLIGVPLYALPMERLRQHFCSQCCWPMQ